MHGEEYGIECTNRRHQLYAARVVETGDIHCMTPRAPDNKHLTIVGAGIAGLYAARTFASRYERITIVDADELPATAAGRDKAPQSAHVHCLLLRGYRDLTARFETLERDLAAAGAPLLDLNADCIYHTPSGTGPRRASNLRQRTTSRLLLEHLMRQAVLADPRVHILGGTDRVGLEADAFVDAGGRRSATRAWLTEAGLPAAPVEETPHDLTYASCVFSRPPDEPPAAAVLLERVDGELRGAWVLPIEQNRVVISLVDFSGKASLATPDELRGFAAGFTAAENVLRPLNGTPLAPQVARFRFRANRLVHFERVPMPANYFVVGDAFCHTSPVLALGITTATTTVNILADVLAVETGVARLPADTSRTYHRRAAKTLARNMTMARTFARRYRTDRSPSAEGPIRALENAFVDSAVSIFARATTRDPRLHALYLALRNQVVSPARVLTPRNLWLIARALAHD
jgi:flavin-dependent dehydrogenase